MGSNTFGQCFSITTFGESHGLAIGTVVDGCPAGVMWKQELLEKNMLRRRPGSSQIVSARKEEDKVEVLSGVFEGKTLGTPIAMIIRNQDARSEDYALIKDDPRPGHADDVWKGKYGHVDHRGGGRASGRETACRVMGGAVAQMMLCQMSPEFQIKAFTSRVGEIYLENTQTIESMNQDEIDSYAARMPCPLKSRQVEELLLRAKQEGKSYGGLAELWVDGVPAYLGQPVFRKLKSEIMASLMSVGAVTGVDIGDGFDSVHREGTSFHSQHSPVYGGIRGGLSTGERIKVRVAFKPTSSVMDVAKKGRHDPCIVPRALPVLESMVSLVLADHLLMRRLDRV